MRLSVLPLVLMLLAATPIAAQTTENGLVAMLQSQGFELVERKKTWLGRIVLEFKSNGREREIIFDPTHGTILRDFWEDQHDDEGSEGFWAHWFGFSARDNDEGHQ